MTIVDDQPESPEDPPDEPPPSGGGGDGLKVQSFSWAVLPVHGSAQAQDQTPIWVREFALEYDPKTQVGRVLEAGEAATVAIHNTVDPIAAQAYEHLLDSAPFLGTSRMWNRGDYLGATISAVGDVIFVLKALKAGRYVVTAVRAGPAVREFRGLSQAAKYGVQEHDKLRNALSGTGLHAHHLIEQRFAGIMGQDVKEMLSIAVTSTEHQVFTNAWRNLFAYGGDYRTLTAGKVLDFARQVYKDHPDILHALGL